jgi:hypothetical protein
MPLKNRAEYEPEDVPEATAKRAVEHAERTVRSLAKSSRSGALATGEPARRVIGRVDSCPTQGAPVSPLEAL